MHHTHKILCGALAGIFTASTMSASAQEDPAGFYVTGYAQVSRLSSTSFNETGTAGFGRGLKADFDLGLGLGGDFGYRYGNGWAAEFESNWRRHELDSLRRSWSWLGAGDRL